MPNSFRIGQGYDSHILVKDRPLIIGGVTIVHDKGLLGHSDADVLLHAVIDALLGAAALGDIGKHFPDTDYQYAGANSRVLLRAVVKLLEDRGYCIGNIDATVIAQAPKLANYIEQMVVNVAADLKIDFSRVNIKAKTNEGMGFVGRQEGIVAQVVALICH